MTAVGTPVRTAPAIGDSALAGTGILVRLALRRDRIKLPVWTLGIAAFVPYFFTVLSTTASTREDLRTYVELLDSPMVRLFTGPAFGLGQVTLERTMVATYFLEFLLAAGLMNILLVTRHTRGEEQSGRAELVRAAVVGRHAPLTAALIVAVVTDMGLGLLIAAAMAAMGFPAGGALLFGAGVAATGLVFAGVAAVTAQLTEHSRVAAGIAGVVLCVAWTVRAAGALQAGQGGWLTWLSPLAWAQQTRVLVDERWWPLALSVVCAGVLAAAGYALSARRDIGAGFVAPRPGRASAAPWLRSPFALALRLQRAAILWWGVALLVAGLVFGGMAGAMGEGAAEEFLGAGADVLPGYLSLMATWMTFLVGVFVVLSVTRLRTEETSGRVTPVLATPTGRWTWLGSALLVSATAAVALLAVTGLAMGVGAAVGVGDGALVGVLTAAVLVRVPEVLLLLALAAALFGLAPRAIGVSWAVLAYGGFVRYFAPRSGLPEWLKSLSPFDHIPRMPLEDFALGPVLALTAIAAGLAVLGRYGFRRRDLDGA